jgi:hypothetical protein
MHRHGLARSSIKVAKKQPYELEMNQAGFDKSFNSALVILDVVFCKGGVPKSLIDIGGGAGAWLLSAKQLGVVELVLVEGEWINKTTLNADFFQLTIRIWKEVFQNTVKNLQCAFALKLLNICRRKGQRVL